MATILVVDDEQMIRDLLRKVREVLDGLTDHNRR